jgi:methyl-accepting chemotaxis protein
MTKSPLDTGIFVSRITAWVGSVSSLVIHTGIFFAIFLLGVTKIASWEILLLVLTTVVSLEAIYLAILIQFTVNRQAESLKSVEQDIDEIQENVDEIQEDVEELGEDVEDIQEDIEEIQEDVEEITDEVVEEEGASETHAHRTLEELTSDMRAILADLESLKRGK